MSAVTQANYQEIISPKRGQKFLNFKEIWRYKDLIMLFVHRDFVSQYKQTILGPLWMLVQPLFTTAMFYFVFSRIAHIPTMGIDPILFYLAGITLWNYFSDCLLKTSNTFISNASIFGKVYFPRLAVPISVVLSGSLKLFVQLALFAVVFTVECISGRHIMQVNFTLIFLPVYILILAILSLSLGIIFSALTTKYRDLNFLLAFGVQLLMYATPVIYPLSFTKGIFRTILWFNPLTPIIENFRYAFFSTGEFKAVGILYSFATAMALWFLGTFVFNRVERNFMDTV